MFESLSDRLSSVFRSFRGAGTLTEENVKAGLREVRLALLEADVNFKVVGDFVSSVREKCLGREITKGMSPAQEVVSVVNEELIKLLGGETAKLNLQGQVPAVIMMVGLQGSGKTTSAAKIANYLRRNKMRPYLVPADVYRPAAIDQLVVLAKDLGMPYYPSTVDMNPVDIARKAFEQAKAEQATVMILDTAGRLHVDEVLMQELSDLKAAVHPQEILFVADAMTGQDAINVAQTFNEKLGITGVVLTKMDGDARGGAALSIKAVTGAPVKFVGMGEKLSELEVFHPDRIAGRILGMGDIVSLVERAQQQFDEKQAKELEKKIRKNKFDFNDFMNQIQQIKKMGNIKDLAAMIPGVGKAIKDVDIDDNAFKSIEAIINSMTPKERTNPEILNQSRRMRIAKGSGTNIQDVNRLLKQFDQMRKMMKMVTGMNSSRMMQMAAAMKNMKGGMPGL